MGLEQFKEHRDSTEHNYAVQLRMEIRELLALLPPDARIELYDPTHEGGLGGFDYTDTMPYLDREGKGIVYNNTDCSSHAFPEPYTLSNMNSYQLEKVLDSVQADVDSTVYTIVYHSITGGYTEPKPEVFYNWGQVEEYIAEEIDNMKVQGDTLGNCYIKDTILNDWFTVYLGTDSNIFAEYYIREHKLDMSKVK